jgi:ABC-2 type transport system ATP-binding protein
MIRVRNLTKRFGRTVAVDAVSFDVERGDVVGFLGPNGAGKTTTIRVLTCFHPATSGTATVGGYDVFERPIDVRRSIGYLPENVPIYTDSRVEEYLRYRAALKGVPRARRRSAVAEAMERCGVTEVRRKMVGQVSRGYRQRVGLADALVAKPPILILDEPTSGLDPNQRRRMKVMIRELAQQHTILFSSHILSEVSDVSSRILIIDRGRIEADGTLTDLLERAPGRRLIVCAALPGTELVEVVGRHVGADHSALVAEEGGYATVRGALAGDADPRDAVSEDLRRRNVPVRELTLALPTLEEYFQVVTEDVTETAP